MSSAVISTSAALSRHFVFDDETAEERPLAEIHKKPAGAEESAAGCAFQSTIHQIGKRQLPIADSILPASQLAIRRAPEMVSSGIPAIDALTGGLPRGCLTEICGPASSGRTTMLLAALAAATQRGEYCAVVDASNALHPQSVAAAGVELDHLLWVRCRESLSQKENSPKRHRSDVAREMRISSQTNFGPNHSASRRVSEHRLEQVLRVTDLLIGGGGFSLIVLDLADLPAQVARRIPLTTWFRFRRAIEHTPTILLAIEQHPIAGTCSSLLLQFGVPDSQHSVSSSGCFLDIEGGWRTTAPGVAPSHAHLLTGLNLSVELMQSRLDRKPARSVTFAAKTAWAG
jgi:recombination protein RecA